MKIIKARDYEDMSRKAAAVIAAQVIGKPDSVLGLATGSTPIGLYRNLVQWYQQGDLDFSEVTTVNLDEYKGLDINSDQSYVYFMNENLFRHVNIRPGCSFLPNGMEPDSQKACKDYDEVLAAAGGIDLQLLGMGHNGHIGFNEPSDHFVLQTNCVDLTESTIRANQRFFSSYEEVPKQAYTMGIRTIMQARKVLVVVNGEEKADIVKKAFFGPVTPQVPASILQLHANTVVVADEAALSKVQL